MKIQVQISRQSEEILKDLKRNCRGLFIDEAIIYFARTPEGRERIERWKREEGVSDSRVSGKDKGNSGEGKRVSFKELAGDFWEE
jgi:DNA-binding PadR family transcriptional regulator